MTPDPAAGHEPAPAGELPVVLARTVGAAEVNRYAAVNDEFIDIHQDPEAGRAAGFPTAIAMGNLTWSYLHIALHRWFGDTARIRSITARFRAPVLLGDELSIHGTVLSAPPETDDGVLTVRLTARCASGTTAAEGSAVVELRVAARSGEATGSAGPFR